MNDDSVTSARVTAANRRITLTPIMNETAVTLFFIRFSSVSWKISLAFNAIEQDRNFYSHVLLLRKLKKELYGRTHKYKKDSNETFHLLNLLLFFPLFLFFSFSPNPQMMCLKISLKSSRGKKRFCNTKLVFFCEI